ncbi:YqhG family protein [Fredinandcohnia quinoae]|uniref:YqhG family protein n=1 Tax=Fredinandcohnia quinoae TaxID=2918902 RepID=A0AAW5DW55_9BACI|nr:YqhG family protein [Fredinandcohnia sp. SECRCQ15]MCH1624870.1 YqhG family protein [Fredinandcohnia sp. SECRCQ15]
MQQQEINDFLEKYFISNQCEILEKYPGYMTVQLTVEIDKLLMNRPFYWTYLEKTNGVPNPMKLTLITNQEQTSDDIKGDFIHFGAPRLHQIFESTKKLASYIRLYQQTNSLQVNTALYPWLGLNIKVSYKCDRKRDLLLSLGLQLVNGMIIEGFQNKIEKLQLTPKIPDLTYTMSSLVKPQSGVNRLQQYIRGFIESEDHSWADEAINRWNEDLALLDSFYEEVEEKPESHEIEKEALREQYEPKVIVEVINGGLFYLCQNAI